MTESKKILRSRLGRMRLLGELRMTIDFLSKAMQTSGQWSEPIFTSMGGGGGGGARNPRILYPAKQYHLKMRILRFS